jgi:hypothetical protein
VPSSSMFKVYSFFFDILTFEDGEATLPWNIHIQLLIGTTSHSKIMESSATLLWKPQNLHPSLCYLPVTSTAFHMVSTSDFLYAFLDSQSRHHSYFLLCLSTPDMQVSKLVVCLPENYGSSNCSAAITISTLLCKIFFSNNQLWITLANWQLNLN